MAILVKESPEVKTADHLGHRARLRERFLKNGAAALADYELLEMLLYAASPRQDTKPLAKRLLKHFGSLSSLLGATVADLLKVEGMGEAAVCAIRISHATHERALKEDAAQGTVIQSWTSLLDYCRVSLGQKKVEEFRVLFLNHKHGLLADEAQQHGTVNHAPVYPREVVKRALELGASAVILVHNHPSGDPTPSKDDITITKQVVEAARSLGISVHDHLIIAGKSHYSFKSNGLI